MDHGYNGNSCPVTTVFFPVLRGKKDENNTLGVPHMKASAIKVNFGAKSMILEGFWSQIVPALGPE